MLRWLGAALILCGGMLTRRALLEESRRAQRTRLALATAFEEMEAEIRLMLTPLPALLRRKRGTEADGFFAPILEGLRLGVPLAEAWRRSAGKLALSDGERVTVAAMGARLGGEEESARAALALAASQMRRGYERIEAKRTENERLTTSICISISLFLAILLL